MADKFDIFEASGAHIGEIPISPQDLERLHAGMTVSITFHTPRMLRSALGERSGHFDMREYEGQLIANDVEAVKRFIELQADIGRMMQQPEKWTDPDAKNIDPVR